MVGIVLVGQPVAWWNIPPLELLIAERCECLWHYLSLLIFTEERFGELPEDNSSSVWISTSSRTMGFFPLSRVVGCFA